MLSRRSFVRAAGASAVAAGLMPWFAQAADGDQTPRKPNVVFILADDVGFECLGAYGCKSYRTPNLDKLAASGMRFDHCYAQPLCTPTRVQLLTGMYNVRNYTQFAHMDEGQVTVANLLKKSGYATGMMGKWQLAGGTELPRRFGFDEFYLWQHLRRPPRYANPGMEINGKKVDFSHGEYGPDLINAAALDFVQQHKDQPFFLYYTMLLAHAPFQPTPDSADWDPKALGEKVNDSPEHFADNMAYLDKMVGKLITRLDELHLRENTLIIFAGDNGTGKNISTEMADGRRIQGGKGMSTDAGTRVPLIVNRPGFVPAGKVSQDLVDFTDFLPTMCQATNTPVPADLAIDGQSFLPQCQGQTGQPRQWVYSWFAPDGGATAKKEFARNQHYKLYREGQFFDVEHDVLEKQPLAIETLDAQAKASRAVLQGALEKYAAPRPAKFVEQAGKPGKGE